VQSTPGIFAPKTRPAGIGRPSPPFAGHTIPVLDCDTNLIYYNCYIDVSIEAGKNARVRPTKAPPIDGGLRVSAADGGGTDCSGL